MRPRFRTADGGYPFPTRSQTRVPAANPIRNPRVRVSLGSPSTRTPFLHLSSSLLQVVPGLLSSPTALMFSLALPGPGAPVVTLAHPAFAPVVPFWLEAPLAGFTLSIEALYSSSIVGVAGITEQSFSPSFVSPTASSSFASSSVAQNAKSASAPSLSDSCLGSSDLFSVSESPLSPERRNSSCPSATPRLNRSLSGSSVSSSLSSTASAPSPLSATNGTLHIALVNTETSQILTFLTLEYLIARPLPCPQPVLPRVRARCHCIPLYHLYVQLTSDCVPVVHQQLTVRSVPFPLGVFSVPRKALCPDSQSSSDVEYCSRAIQNGTLSEDLARRPMTLERVLMSLPQHRHAIVELVWPDKFLCASNMGIFDNADENCTETSDVNELNLDAENGAEREHDASTVLSESGSAPELALPDLNTFADAVISACIGKVAALVATDPDLCTLLAVKQTALPVFCRVPDELEPDTSSSIGSSSTAPLVRSSFLSSGRILPNPRMASVDAAASFAQSVGLRGLIISKKHVEGAKGEARRAAARNCGLAVVADMDMSSDFACCELSDAAQDLYVDGALARNGISVLTCSLFGPGEVDSETSDEEGDLENDLPASLDGSTSSLEPRSMNSVDHDHDHRKHRRRHHHHHHHHRHNSHSGVGETLCGTKSVSWNDPVVTPPRVSEDYETDTTLM